MAVAGRWKYPAQMKTPMGTLERAEEIVREKMYQYFRNEIPYVCKTRIEGWKVHDISNDNKGSDQKVLEVHVSVYCPRPAYVKFVGRREKLELIQHWTEASLCGLLKVPRVDLHFTRIVCGTVPI